MLLKVVIMSCGNGTLRIVLMRIDVLTGYVGGWPAINVYVVIERDPLLFEGMDKLFANTV